MIDKRSESNMPSADGKTLDEGWKLHFEMFKHLTTLNTGAILIVVTLLEKLFSNPKWKILVGVSFLCFIVSIITSLSMMNITSLYFKYNRQWDKFEERRETVLYWMSLLGFQIGLIFLIAFTMINFYF